MIKLRVLIANQYYWPENFRINDIAKTLVEKGIEVDVLTGHGDINVRRMRGFAFIAFL
jgi:thiazole synthase ThiGH ThiG subunit